MLSTSKIQYIQSLTRKKFRQKYNKFVIEGEKMAIEVLQNQRIKIESVYALDSWIETNQALLKLHLDKVISIKEKELQKISSLTTANKVLLIAENIDNKLDNQLLTDDLSLYLNEIQDPGNMGTILRIADWFGISQVFYSKGCVEIYSPKVIQASMGAFLRVSFMEYELADLKSFAPKLPVYGTVLGGDNIFQTPIGKPAMIVVGNEGKGINADLDGLLTHKIMIPAHSPNGAESLNAAVATGIVCALFRNL